jgi:protein-tyrosine phosphatase
MVADTDTDTDPTSADTQLDVLLLCTANICRSPMALHLLRDGLDRLSEQGMQKWRIGSAGTQALVGAPMHPVARQVIEELGIEVPEMVARQADAALISGSTLILTATRGQRRFVAETLPSAIRRVFTMRQFARMCRAGSDRRPVALVRSVESLTEVASSGRMLLQPVDAIEADIPDPYGEDLERFRACRDRIAEAVDGMLMPLAAAP